MNDDELQRFYARRNEASRATDIAICEVALQYLRRWDPCGACDAPGWGAEGAADEKVSKETIHVSDSIELSIPSGLTAAYIERINSSIDKTEADTLAAELHDIIRLYRQLFLVRPPDCGEHASEEVDMSLTLWRTALDLRRSDDAASAGESVWLVERLEAVGDDGALYERYLKLADRINGTNIAELFL
jgi:hypothetical protein